MKSSLPTDSELNILKVLWEKGPSRVRDVHQELGKVGYTTVLKLLQIMHNKGIVERERAGSGHIYSPAVSREVTEQRLVARLVDEVFDGSTHRLIMSALGPEAVSRAGLKKIRKQIKKEEAAR
ncbi:MAG: BlaI/MecI/CopY family transcriptional regulator [Gemmatimonadaceae bacterium]